MGARGPTRKRRPMDAAAAYWSGVAVPGRDLEGSP
jgi:hypothetical protein